MKTHQHVTQSHNSGDFHSVTNALERQAPALHMLTFQHYNPTQRDELTTGDDPEKRSLCPWAEFAPNTQQFLDSAAGSGTMQWYKRQKALLYSIYPVPVDITLPVMLLPQAQFSITELRSWKT